MTSPRQHARKAPPSRIAVPAPPLSPRPLHVMAAAAEGNDSALTSWLDAGGRVDASGDGGETVLMGAAASGNLKLVELLLERGANVNQQEERTGRTALMAACAAPCPHVARVLLDAGAKYQLKNSDGLTVLQELSRATRSRVLGPVEFIRTIECTRAITDHVEEMEARLRRVPEPENTVSEADDAGIIQWMRRIKEERGVLSKLVDENKRRGMDLEDRLEAIVSEASGRNLLDRTKDAAQGFRNLQRSAHERDEWAALIAQKEAAAEHHDVEEAPPGDGGETSAEPPEAEAER